MYYLCNENKGTDQLQGYSAAELRLCFRICKKQVFSWPRFFSPCLLRSLSLMKQYNSPRLNSLSSFFSINTEKFNFLLDLTC